MTAPRFLYHGTNGAWLDNILRVGLEPRGARTSRDNWKHVPHRSNPRAVYLTDSYAPYFAVNASRGASPSCAVIEIDVARLDPNLLLPDEDAWEQLGRNRDNLPGTMSQRTVKYRNAISRTARASGYHADRDVLTQYQAKDGATGWQLSLRALGTCCHYGAIPASAITRAVVWSHVTNAWMSLVWDPTITLMNQRVCGDRYRALTAKLFGDAPLPVHEFEADIINRFDPSRIKDLRRINLTQS